MADVIADASPLIFLARLRRLDLAGLLGPVVVPGSVRSEILGGQEKDAESVSRFSAWLGSRRVRVEDIAVPDSFMPDLGAGERAVLLLARDASGSLALIDDRAARRAARFLSVKTLSTAFLLIRAVQEKELRSTEALEDLDRLVALGYYLDPRLYADIRVRLGKSDR